MSIAHIYFWPKSVKFCTFCNSRLSNQPLHLTEIGQISSLKNWSLQYICDRLLTFDRNRLNFFHVGVTKGVAFHFLTDIGQISSLSNNEKGTPRSNFCAFWLIFIAKTCPNCNFLTVFPRFLHLQIHFLTHHTSTWYFFNPIFLSLTRLNQKASDSLLTWRFDT